MEPQTTTSHAGIPTITDRTFEAEVLGSPVPVLLDFSTVWCPPCEKLKPILARLAAEHAGKIKVVMIDGDDQAALASRYKVRAFPTIIAFAGGKEIGRHVGLTQKERLLSLLGDRRP